KTPATIHPESSQSFGGPRCVYMYHSMGHIASPYPLRSRRGPPTSRSLARSEHLVEQVAEPRLEYVDFSFGDGNALGPIVGDCPMVEIVLRRTAASRRCRLHIVEWIVRDRFGLANGSTTRW